MHLHEPSLSNSRKRERKKKDEKEAMIELEKIIMIKIHTFIKPMDMTHSPTQLKMHRNLTSFGNSWENMLIGKKDSMIMIIITNICTDGHKI